MIKTQLSLIPDLIADQTTIISNNKQLTIFDQLKKVKQDDQTNKEDQEVKEVKKNYVYKIVINKADQTSLIYGNNDQLIVKSNLTDPDLIKLHLSCADYKDYKKADLLVIYN